MTSASSLKTSPVGKFAHFDAVSNRLSSLLLPTIIVLVLLVQQYAFIQIPAIDAAPEPGRKEENFGNTVAVGLSLVAMGSLWLWNVRPLARLASKNAACLSYMALVLVSVAWSVHPDLTIRRGTGYILSILVAALLTVRFDAIERMRILSASFAISAIGSVIFVAIRPEWAIMNIDSLEGNWRGVFPHKTSLGLVMAVAVFTELYLLIADRGRPRWRFALLGLYLALVALSHSATGLSMSVAFAVSAGIHWLWIRHRVLGQGALLVVGLNALVLICFLWIDPELPFGLIGKDAGLTGRTELWDVVLDSIDERPLFGHGFQAMWGVDDALTIRANRLTGDWGVKGSHNAYLEVCLELGLVGLFVLVSIIAAGLRRGLRCCSGQAPRLGWFSVTFFLVAAASGLTELTLGLNQDIIWLVLTMLVMSCGPGVVGREAEAGPLLTRSIHKKRDPNARHRTTRTIQAPTG